MKTKIIFLCIIIVLSLIIGSYTIEGFATKTITDTQKTEIVKTIKTIKEKLSLSDKQHKIDYSNAINYFNNTKQISNKDAKNKLKSLKFSELDLKYKTKLDKLIGTL